MMPLRWLHLGLALVSGVAALVYQVVWTREMALLGGSHIEAVSLVLVAFFGGLALGSRVLGPVADGVARPLRLFALFEGSAGALAIASSPWFRWLGERAALGEGTPVLAGAATLLAPMILLGGALPALVRSATADPRRSAEVAGTLVGVNTLGALLGVGLAAGSIPIAGLERTVQGAGSLAVALACIAAWVAPPRTDLARPAVADSIPLGALGESAEGSPSVLEESGSEARAGVPALVLVAAALAGAATLAFEVLAARAAALLLGSSLLSWTAVLGSVLGGLAVGNLLAARRSAASRTPETDLGCIETLAAAAILLGLYAILPPLGASARGASAATLGAILFGVAIPAVLMGAAFPFFVRVALGSSRAIGGGLGRLSAANTAGGIGGALAAPFVLLPLLGPSGAAYACALANASLGFLFLARGARSAGARPWLRMGIATVGLLAAAVGVRLAPGPRPSGHVLFVGHDAQATVVAVHHGARRDLLVDGEAEASTGGAARRTEELLATLPILLHPAPKHLLEVGLGSGITLGTAARFDLERIDCVEIAAPVLEAAQFFAPDNRDIAGGADPRVRIRRGDGRLELTRHRDAYDLVIANTVHPWSVGSTGLYSREYFARIAGALRAEGLAAQWLPVEQIGGESLAAVLATFFQVFPYGGVWWADESILLIGATSPLADFDAQRSAARLRAAGLSPQRLGLRNVASLPGRRIARAETVRQVLGEATRLSDDRPILELQAVRRGRQESAARSPLEPLLALSVREGGGDALRFWIRARMAERAGRHAESEALAQLAEDLGLELARERRLGRRTRAAREALEAGRAQEAADIYREVLAQEPGQSAATFGLALAQLAEGRTGLARDTLRQLVRAHPDHAEGWNLLGVLSRREGERLAARNAFASALEADPFSLPALANAGLLAIEDRNHARAEQLLARLRAASPLGPSPEETTLRRALADQSAR